MSNLAELIRLSGIKQEIVAKEAGVSQATISFWKSGKKKPTLENAIVLAKIFGVSVGCIAGTERIPDGYPNNCDQPSVYDEATRKDVKPAKDPQPAFVTFGNRVPEGSVDDAPDIPFTDAPAPVYSAKNEKKPPFTREQSEYLERMEERIVCKMSELIGSREKGII